MRKTRADSTHAAVAAMKAAGSIIEPPAHTSLRDCDRPFWASVIAAKPADRWSPGDLEDAAILSATKADIVRLQAEIDREGDVIGQRINPKHALIETLTRRSMALSRTLQIHARARHGESRDQRPTQEAAAKVRTALRLVETDDLIPGLKG